MVLEIASTFKTTKGSNAGVTLPLELSSFVCKQEQVFICTLRSNALLFVN